MEEISDDDSSISIDDIAESEIYLSVNKNSKRILVVDDILYVVKSIARILTGMGYMVITAYTGKDAIERFKKYAPHMVTVDQKLPDMTGFQLVEKLRALEGGQNLKIIFISAVYAKEEIKSILNLGIDNYILKPFKKEKLIDCVTKLLPDKNE